MHILTQIFEKRGLKIETAKQVAIELSEKNALETHMREELGINELSQSNPIQAAIASGASFLVSMFREEIYNASITNRRRSFINIYPMGTKELTDKRTALAPES